MFIMRVFLQNPFILIDILTGQRLRVTKRKAVPPYAYMFLFAFDCGNGLA